MDQVTVQVIGNAMLSVAEEMGAVLRRASYSTNIKERADCSTALFDARGRLVAQAEHIPIHMGSMKGLVTELLDTVGADGLRDGDVYITNDPYTGGGTHLPDITMAAPVFLAGRLVGFSANIAHHSDVGGHVPGSNSGDSTSIFQEGLRIPAVRFMVGGTVNEEVVAFVTLNSRLPEERRGDLLAQLAAVHTGGRRFADLHDKYGSETVVAASEQLLEYARKRLELAVGAIPDGVYTAADWLDADEPGQEPIRVRAAVTVRGAELSVSFDGTGRQANVAINVVRSALEATVYYALKAALDPDIPANGGFFDAVAIDAPEGSIVNPRSPAPVAARTDACQRIADVLLAALAKAVPDRVPAGSHSSITYVTFAGTDADFFVYPEVIAGGAGARPDRDGLDAVQVHVTNSSNLPIEALELEYPLRVETYELITDSGGAGEYRGGLGVRRDIRVLADHATFSAHADRQTFPPQGLAGGRDGSTGRFVLRPGTDTEQVLPGGRVSGIALRAGDVLRIESPGSGGYGDPHARPAESVAADVRQGRVSAESARDDYGRSDA
ncbi:hydantoinase B/oxoprolinase family protein [Actinophytocola sp. S1-96]|uniref:Hydantoinase B/oxoprolinase family protein n=1 Tax=Actinophytocola gossypii TaxID=2812003 RepID=A0ABT2J9D7_9PSEU|nr:hydantoinase B/oxoprolinase family protein [Actinophytocola gossypii]